MSTMLRRRAVTCSTIYVLKLTLLADKRPPLRLKYAHVRVPLARRDVRVPI